jgi:putative ABC transport system permease protein
VTRLPLLTRVLLRLTDPRVREFVAGDLEESFAARIASDDARLARGWSYRQALSAALQHPWRPHPANHVRGDGLMRTFLQDLRYGTRMIGRQPAFSAVVVMTLALAIGANTVIFSFANVLLFRPLPIKDTATLGWIFAIDPHRGGDRGPLSIPEFMDYRKALTTFDALAASMRANVTLTGRGDARRLTASRVTANLIDVWGLRLQQGRGFSNGADTPGAPGEVVISHHYWTRDLASDPSIVGKVLTLDGNPATVMGVLAPDIEIGNISEIDVWVPLSLSADLPREERTLRVNGRLKPGVTLAQASADVLRFAQVLSSQHPNTNGGWTARVLPSREAMTGSDTFPIMALLGLVVGFVLLLACANLANLVLSRATGRRRELAVRSALGASRGRVIRQMLTENLIYGIGGGAAGLGVAYGGLAMIRAAAYEPFFAMVRIDGNVLGFTTLLALLTPMLFAILPALHSTRAAAGDALKDAGTRTAGGASATRSRSVLIVAQLGLAVMLLVLATLLVQALVNISAAPLGIDAPRLLAARVDLPAWRYGNTPAIAGYTDRLLARLQSHPGIDAAALTTRLPFIDGEPITDVAIDGRPSARPEDRPWAVTTAVSDSYFSTLGIRMIAGRPFTSQDEPGRAPVAIINIEMARRYFGSAQQAVGARLSLAGSEPSAGSLEVVGVVADVLRADREGVNPQVYVSTRQRPSKSLTLMVRANDPDAVAASVRAEIRALDADVPVYEMRPMEDAIDEDLSSSRVLGSLFVSFALLALALAASGLYAVVSYSASQRVKEFGVRIALGAAPRDITRMMLGQTARLVAIGLVIGLAGGRLLAIGAATLLYQVSPSDPVTYAGVAIALGSIALLASYVPARRATAVDPVTALRD